MTSNQITEFENGAGSFFTANDMLVLIQSVGAMLLLTYVAWLCVSAYKDYGEERISAGAMMNVWIRAVFVLMFLLWIIIN